MSLSSAWSRNCAARLAIQSTGYPAVDHRGRECDSVMHRDGRDRAVLAERHSNLAGELRPHHGRINHEDHRLVVLVDKLHGPHHCPQIMRAGLSGHHDQVRDLHHCPDCFGDCRGGVEKYRLDPMRDKPRPSGRGRIARTAQPSPGVGCGRPWRGLLLFDVLADDGDWRSSTG